MKDLRLNAALEQMKNEGLTQMVVSDPISVYYLTGEMVHPGERLLALYINVNGNHKLFISELFPIHNDLGVEIVYFTDNENPVEYIANVAEKNAPMGIDKNWPARFLISLMDLNGGSKFQICNVIDNLRTIKDEEEKDAMRLASKLNDEAMGKLIDSIKGDETEIQLANRLAKIYEEQGTQGFSFDPIIVFGANAADPHGEPGNNVAKVGDTVIIDIGCLKDNYCSDMTRTVFLKEPSTKGKEVYEIVAEANRRAEAIIKPGVKFSEIDAAARDFITEKGYGKYFTHRTGHSIGLDVHDLGDVSGINNNPVQPGMIFSIEPGIYLPGELGVRIEDLVLVTEDGCEILNSYSKDIITVG
ncbi:MAG: Xaa-Pro peptidase family protein [Clostridioides sp.]|nr:Xaa-Pro peptidase family protein [Clostridioides sp.]